MFAQDKLHAREISMADIPTAIKNGLEAMSSQNSESVK